MAEPRVIPIPCPFPNGTVYAYYVDAPQPALIDTGVAASPASVIAPALAAQGLRLEDVRWILLTHGHWDHMGGAAAIKRAVGEAAVAVHADDVFMVRDRSVHLDSYAGVRYRFLDDPAALAQTDALLMEHISGELAVDRELAEGDRVDLGGGLRFSVVHTPGHSPGSATYLLEGPRWAFTGDAVQVCGSKGGRIPLYVDPVGYRSTLDRLLSDVRPRGLYMGHQFRLADGSLLEAQLHGPIVSSVLKASVDMEARLAGAAAQIVAPTAPGALVAAFVPAAEVLGYAPDEPTSWPGPFFTTLSGYSPRLSPPAHHPNH